MQYAANISRLLGRLNFGNAILKMNSANVRANESVLVASFSPPTHTEIFGGGGATNIIWYFKLTESALGSYGAVSLFYTRNECALVGL